MKRCSTCKIEKPYSSFNKQRSRKDGLQSACRDCNKQRSRAYYADHKLEHVQTTLQKHKEYRDRNRRVLLKYLQQHPCVDCGNSDIRVLEFDHVSGIKATGVAKLAQRAASVETIMQEIAKCEVRCRKLSSYRYIRTYGRYVARPTAC